MNLFEATVFVTEVAALAIRAELLTVELAAVLRLVFVILACLLLLVQIELVTITELLIAVGILTLGPVATEPSV